METNKKKPLELDIKETINLFLDEIDKIEDKRDDKIMQSLKEIKESMHDLDMRVKKLEGDTECLSDYADSINIDVSDMDYRLTEVESMQETMQDDLEELDSILPRDLQVLPHDDDEEEAEPEPEDDDYDDDEWESEGDDADEEDDEPLEDDNEWQCLRFTTQKYLNEKALNDIIVYVSDNKLEDPNEKLICKEAHKRFFLGFIRSATLDDDAKEHPITIIDENEYGTRAQKIINDIVAGQDHTHDVWFKLVGVTV